jgi:hypothetical protein
MSFKITPLTVSIREAKAAECSPSVAELREAAARFAKRSDTFANGKAETCHDLADKLKRYGSYASEAQQGFAAKLVAWSKPKAGTATVAVTPAQRVPSLFAVMQKHSHFYLGAVTLARKNQDTLVWIKHERHDGVIGKIEDGVVSLFAARMRSAGIDAAEIVALLDDIEENPLAAAIKFGKLSGRCCSCGRDLTNEGSIEAGIGPICAQKFA